MSAEHTPQYEVTHCHNNPEIAYVKRSPHKCVVYGEYKCVGVQDEIAMISLPRVEPEMTEIIRRSNAHDELVAALSAITDRYAAEVLRTDGQKPSENEYVNAALAALKKAHGGTA